MSNQAKEQWQKIPQDQFFFMRLVMETSEWADLAAGMHCDKLMSQLEKAWNSVHAGQRTMTEACDDVLNRKP